MLEVLSGLQLGLEVALQPHNLLFAFIGVLLGTLVGVLPGIGPLATMAMLLPFTFHLDPSGAIIMLAGIYYGAQYGGSTTAILVNMPGESSAIVTCIDGYQMMRRGRAGPALAVAALGSFFAGTVATLVIALFAPALTTLGLMFQPADYFSLMILGLIAAVVLATGSVLRAIAMIMLGLLLGLVGPDPNTGAARFSFGQTALLDGLNFVPIAVGVFGVSEIILNLTGKEESGSFKGRITQLWPSLEDFKRSWAPVLRGTGLGSVLGILPGGGAMLSSFASYMIEKRISPHKEEFGHGAIEGVAGPESANNAGSQTAFIPMLTLGIPSNAIMAVMIGAITIQGLAPGPQMMTQQPDLFWGLIASMWVGNLMLVIINLPLVGIWVKLLAVPYKFLYPSILIFACIGVYSVNNSTFDIMIAAGFGLLGYMLRRLNFEVGPLLLGMVLGPLMEENLRRALVLSRGSADVFVTRPISATLLSLTVVILLLMIVPSFRKNREEAFKE